MPRWGKARGVLKGATKTKVRWEVKLLENNTEIDLKLEIKGKSLTAVSPNGTGSWASKQILTKLVDIDRIKLTSTTTSTTGPECYRFSILTYRNTFDFMTFSKEGRSHIVHRLVRHCAATNGEPMDKVKCDIFLKELQSMDDNQTCIIPIKDVKQNGKVQYLENEQNVVQSPVHLDTEENEQNTLMISEFVISDDNPVNEENTLSLSIPHSETAEPLETLDNGITGSLPSGSITVMKNEEMNIGSGAPSFNRQEIEELQQMALKGLAKYKDAHLRFTGPNIKPILPMNEPQILLNYNMNVIPSRTHSESYHIPSLEEWTRESVELQNRLKAMQQRAESFTSNPIENTLGRLSTPQRLDTEVTKSQLLEERQSLQQRMTQIDADLNKISDNSDSSEKKGVSEGNSTELQGRESRKSLKDTIDTMDNQHGKPPVDNSNRDEYNGENQEPQLEQHSTTCICCEKKCEAMKEATELLLEVNRELTQQLEAAKANKHESFTRDISSNEVVSKEFIADRVKSKLRNQAKYVMEVRKVLSILDWYRFKNLMNSVKKFYQKAVDEKVNRNDRDSFINEVASEITNIFEDGQYSRDSAHLMQNFDLLIVNEEDKVYYHEQLEHNQKVQELEQHMNLEKTAIQNMESKLEIAHDQPTKKRIQSEGGTRDYSNELRSTLPFKGLNESTCPLPTISEVRTIRSPAAPKMNGEHYMREMSLPMILHGSSDTFDVNVSTTQVGVDIAGEQFRKHFSFTEIQKVQVDDFNPFNHFQGNPNPKCCMVIWTTNNVFLLEAQTKKDRSQWLKNVQHRVVATKRQQFSAVLAVA